MSEQNQQPASSNPADASGIDNHFRDMGEKYLGWAKADVARIEDLIRGLRATPSDAEAIEQVFKVAHGIKGQGSTFGYELMTEVGQVLSEYLKKRPNPLTADQLNIIEQHARAMKLILERKITGTGGEVGQKLVSRLKALAAPASAG
jgi:chemotaxis protein histidine kinase CheA